MPHPWIHQHPPQCTSIEDGMVCVGGIWGLLDGSWRVLAEFYSGLLDSPSGRSATIMQNSRPRKVQGEKRAQGCVEINQAIQESVISLGILLNFYSNITTRNQ